MMIYPIIGLSMLTHLAIISATKAKKAIWLPPIRKRRAKNSLLHRILLSFAIAATIEMAMGAIIFTSALMFNFSFSKEGSTIQIVRSMHVKAEQGPFMQNNLKK